MPDEKFVTTCYLFYYKTNIVFKCTVVCKLIPKTLHLILRCAAPPNFLMVQPYLSITTFKAAEPRNLCGKNICGKRKVQSTEILSF